MATTCLAFSNNDVIVIAWAFEGKLDDCVGFDIRRIDADKADTGSAAPQGVSLPAMASFPSDPQGGQGSRTTAESPIQKFFWKDLFARDLGADKLFIYQIVPL